MLTLKQIIHQKLDHTHHEFKCAHLGSPRCDVSKMMTRIFAVQTDDYLAGFCFEIKVSR